VKLSFAYDEAVTIPFATANGTAVSGSDYTTTSGSITIPAGRIAQTLIVPILGDRIPESTEEFLVNLGSATNATIAEGQGVATIRDNEPLISINSVCKNEGNSGTRLFVFTVRLSAVYSQAVTVDYSTADGTALAGSDYRAKSGTLTFAPGQRTKTIAIVVYGTDKEEFDEYFFVNLSNPSENADLLEWQGVGTIVNDD
jgi:hypothetical protein